LLFTNVISIIFRRSKRAAAACATAKLFNNSYQALPEIERLARTVDLDDSEWETDAEEDLPEDHDKSDTVKDKLGIADEPTVFEIWDSKEIQSDNQLLLTIEYKDESGKKRL